MRRSQRCRGRRQAHETGEPVAAPPGSADVAGPPGSRSDGQARSSVYTARPSAVSRTTRLMTRRCQHPALRGGAGSCDAVRAAASVGVPVGLRCCWSASAAESRSLRRAVSASRSAMRPMGGWEGTKRPPAALTAGRPMTGSWSGGARRLRGQRERQSWAVLETSRTTSWARRSSTGCPRQPRGWVPPPGAIDHDTARFAVNATVTNTPVPMRSSSQRPNSLASRIERDPIHVAWKGELPTTLRYIHHPRTVD